MKKKVTVDYDETTGVITDSVGMMATLVNMKPFQTESAISDATIKLIQLGVSPDDIIKLKNQELL